MTVFGFYFLYINRVDASPYSVQAASASAFSLSPVNKKANEDELHSPSTGSTEVPKRIHLAHTDRIQLKSTVSSTILYPTTLKTKRSVTSTTRGDEGIEISGTSASNYNTTLNNHCNRMGASNTSHPSGATLFRQPPKYFETHHYDPETKEKCGHTKLFLNVTTTFCEESLCDTNGYLGTHCYCDNYCLFYGDCCYSVLDNLGKDASNGSGTLYDVIELEIQKFENKTLMLRKDLISCVGDSKNDSAFTMVSKCENNTFDVKNVIDKCELSDSSYSFTNIPVDHIVDKKVLATFKNIYCALCNRISTDELIFWQVNINCKSVDLKSLSNMALDDIASIPDCSLRPHSLHKLQLRQCYKGKQLPKVCQSSVSLEIKNICYRYVYPLAIMNDSSLHPSVVYKNPHCAACETGNLDFSKEKCVAPPNAHTIPQTTIHHIVDGGAYSEFVDLQVLFDFSAENGISSRVECVHTRSCKSYEIFDCFSRRCRQLYCPPGKISLHGKCENVNRSSFNVVADSTRPVENTNTTTEIRDIFIVELVGSEALQMLLYALGISESFILNRIYHHLILRPNISVTNVPEECPCLQVEILEEADNNIVKNWFPELISFFDEIEKTEARSFSLIPSFLQIRNFHNLSSLSCTEGKLITEHFPSIVEVNSSLAFTISTLGINVYEQNCYWQYRYNKSIGIFSSLIATCLLEDNRPNLNCSMVAYDQNEVILANNSLQIINTSHVVYKDVFTVYQNKVLICFDQVPGMGNFVNVFAFSANHKTLSIVTSSFSLVSAVVIIIVHCCIKRFRNIHGLNLTALSVSVMFLHIHLIAQSSLLSHTACIIFAVTLHLIFLNNFVWTNIIGYDISRVFIGDIIVSIASPWKRFLGYVAISIVLPIFVVGLSGSLDFTNSGFKPGYGANNVCWLSNGRSILLFVIGPVILSLLLNFCLFTFTVNAIRNKRKQTSFARKSATRMYLVVYLKLTIILGMTWIVGIIGAFVRQEWLWIVHLVLNGLQGFSLLVCSLVNARNIRNLRSCLKTENSNSSGTSRQKRPVISTKL